MTHNNERPPSVPTTSSMVERVAQTLCDRMPGSCYSMIDGKPCICTGIARAAIEAMREPTEAIAAAATPYCRFEERDCWQAMLDAALKP